MSSYKSSKSKTPGKAENAKNGAISVLALLNEAANGAPVPGLKQGAAAALKLVEIAENFKHNKKDFKRIAKDAAAIVAAVFRSFTESPNQENWPPNGSRDALFKLVETVEEIRDFALKMADRGIFIRILNSLADGRALKEYRERLQAATTEFQISALLDLGAKVSGFGGALRRTDTPIVSLKRPTPAPSEVSASGPDDSQPSSSENDDDLSYLTTSTIRAQKARLNHRRKAKNGERRLSPDNVQSRPPAGGKKSGAKRNPSSGRDKSSTSAKTKRRGRVDKDPVEEEREEENLPSSNRDYEGQNHRARRSSKVAEHSTPHTHSPPHQPVPFPNYHSYLSPPQPGMIFMNRVGNIENSTFTTNNGIMVNGK